MYDIVDKQILFRWIKLLYLYLPHIGHVYYWNSNKSKFQLTCKAQQKFCLPVVLGYAHSWYVIELFLCFWKIPCKCHIEQDRWLYAVSGCDTVMFDYSRIIFHRLHRSNFKLSHARHANVCKDRRTYELLDNAYNGNANDRLHNVQIIHFEFRISWNTDD